MEEEFKKNGQERRWNSPHWKTNSLSMDGRKKKIMNCLNFARVCKRKKNSNCSKLVQYILYKSQNIKARSLGHGKHFVLQKSNFSWKKNCWILNPVVCLLTPDGLVRADQIVEIKCLYAAYRLQLTPEEATKKRK